MKLAQRFQSAFNRTARRTAIFGLPTTRSLIVVTRATGQLPNYLQIDPTPSISTVSPKIVRQLEGLQLELSDLMVDGISKSFSREQLIGPGKHYLIDGELYQENVNGTYVTRAHGGQEAERVKGSEIMFDQLVHWRLILRQRRQR